MITFKNSIQSNRNYENLDEYIGQYQTGATNEGLIYGAFLDLRNDFDSNKLEGSVYRHYLSKFIDLIQYSKRQASPSLQLSEILQAIQDQGLHWDEVERY
jgi:hypothetical protein